MRAIVKGSEPTQLAQYRAQPGAVYAGGKFTPVKDCIRDSLLKEQGYLCAYCMQRISLETIKVEHWHSQSQNKYPLEQLQYRNLLGCCPGNEGNPYRNQHCDTRKGDDDISLNPSESSHHQRMKIRYAGDGTITSEDVQFNTEINEILNLNWKRLKDNRMAVWDAVTDVLSRGAGSRTRPEIESLIRQWMLPSADGRLNEYCAVAIYYLEKKLRRTA